MFKDKLESINWSSNLAYAVGLLTADGNLSKDGRHIEFCSKDKELVSNFKRSLRLTNKICFKRRSKDSDKKYFRIQFGNVKFYRFLSEIGLFPRKSLILESLLIPREFFAHFLRGLFEGDGSIYAFRHPESQYPQLRVRIISGSKEFLIWLRDSIRKFLRVNGIIRSVPRANELCFYMGDSIKIVNYIYKERDGLCLRRKYDRAIPYLN